MISLPYSVLVILPRLRTLDDAIVEAACDLGASDLRAFLLVTLPLLGARSAVELPDRFTTSFDEFAIASFLAPSGLADLPGLSLRGLAHAGAAARGDRHRRR